MQTAVATAKVWIGGEWRESDAEGVFEPENPATGEKLGRAFPVSGWSDCDRALTAAVEAAHALEQVAAEKIATFLESYARELEANAEAIAQAAHEETALPVSPRLKDVELPRATDQLRQAAAAAREGAWRRATLDGARNIRSCYAPIGPVVVFGPNNFPFAFNGVSGGDFAAAIAAGNPVIAKAHPLHAYTSQLMAEAAAKALKGSGLPAATVQMIYKVSHENGERLVSDPRIGAVGFTGSKGAGLKLKHAADTAGKPIYLEMSSLNPVIFLPEGLKENTQMWARELADSCTVGSGQFCTRPNLTLLIAGETAEVFLQELATAFKSSEPHALLSSSSREQLHASIEALQGAGATLVTGGRKVPGDGYRYASTLLRVSGKAFLAQPEELQREAFGNEVMAIVAADEAELVRVLEHLEGNLTGCVYSNPSGTDDALYTRLSPVLRRKVGRLLNDKMPTGVAVSPAMNHGGPYPATGHPGFTAVGIPASIARFTTLQCYDNVREDRLPAFLRGA
ncbi:MAG TPA: aldehyde dehydrogenase family protein [Acidobacteriaceae bacterium]|jgi:NADP-dependent aldehyde dehydrogenase|nr:aldehyde dehydrogenase family protein [Acidobacteriaceae bacterium]